MLTWVSLRKVVPCYLPSWLLSSYNLFSLLLLLLSWQSVLSCPRLARTACSIRGLSCLYACSSRALLGMIPAHIVLRRGSGLSVFLRPVLNFFLRIFLCSAGP